MDDETRKRLIDARTPKEKKKPTPIRKKSLKKQAAEKAEREARAGGPTELQKWFKAQIRLMTYCEESDPPVFIFTGKYHKDINCVCHILSQQQCESVKTHPLNRVFLQEDLHKKFDQMSWEEREQMRCWPSIRERLVNIYVDIDPKERRHFPDSVLKYIEQQNPFQDEVH